jgi:hypothetical protein
MKNEFDSRIIKEMMIKLISDMPLTDLLILFKVSKAENNYVLPFNDGAVKYEVSLDMEKIAKSVNQLSGNYEMMSDYLKYLIEKRDSSLETQSPFK